VKDQSHKDEMSAALRGDFERLRKRGVSVSLAPAERPAEPEPRSDEWHDDPPDVPAADEQAGDARPTLFGRLFGR
jgi:hypothetical protein